ncbi:crossover junction endodeoxyribonuclease RuvC [bacterium]|nr:crossover junction endodeoxyribonuclease RuvC [bacterium]|tara:strand:+ start:979 stop:1449 length:471 start_codon:yes stop_codon:yes gene_type:complete
MRVLAIDPGYDRFGVAVLEHGAERETLLHSGCVLTDKQANLPDRLQVVGEAVEELIATHQPDTLAIETLFFNKNQKTALGVAQVRGICIYLAKHAGCQVVELSPQEIKIAVTGYGKSDKRAVIDMVCRLLPDAPTDALDDEYDAIAVGITTLAHHR